MSQSADSLGSQTIVGLFNDRELAGITNPRIYNLKEHTLPWKFAISHCPGKWQKGPDALSRYPVSQVFAVFSDDSIPPVDSDEMLQVASISSLDHLGCVTFDDVVTAACADDHYQDLLNMVVGGFPEKRNATEPAHLREFWEVRHRLSVLDGVVLLDQRLVIPRALRKVVLERLHSANQGVTGMKFRANQCVYWPGLDASIRSHRDTCQDCIKHAPSQGKEPLILTPAPSYPFQQICADYFEISSHGYLVVADRFSGWLCIFWFRPYQRTSKKLQDTLRDLFVAYGSPEELSSDGGPQFSAGEFKNFLKLWGIKHRLSSVNYPQSNGRAEVAVKSAKRIIHNNVSADGSLNNDRAAHAILQHRNTPLPGLGLSPAQILLHRQLRDSVPAHPKHYRLHKEWIISADEREEAMSNAKQLMIDGGKELLPLELGSNVVVQEGDGKWTRTGTVVEVLPNRQYRVRMLASGRVTLRNRRFLKLYKAATPVSIRPLPSVDAPSPESAPLLESPVDTTPPVDIPDRPEPSMQVQDVPVRDSPADATPRALPRALRNLMPHNAPGLKE